MKLMVLTLLLLASAAEASDWQYSGYSATGGEKAAVFFDLDSLSRPAQDTVRVWTKLIKQGDLDRFFKAHNKVVVDKSARRIALGDIPRYLGLASVTSKYDAELLRDFAIEITTYEVVANEPESVTDRRIYMEIDCAGQRFKILDATFFSASGPMSAGQAQRNYSFIPPDSNVQWLAQMVCERQR